MPSVNCFRRVLLNVGGKKIIISVPNGMTEKEVNKVMVITRGYLQQYVFLETSLQLRIYFGRALPNWVVVVSRPSNRKGAATLVTQQFLASSEGVCQTRSLGRC